MPRLEIAFTCVVLWVAFAGIALNVAQAIERPARSFAEATFYLMMMAITATGGGLTTAHLIHLLTQ